MKATLKRAFRWWLDRLDWFDIDDGQGDVFFTRYDLLKTRWVSVYLHEFFRSDMDLCLHDHPWDFWTLILRGGYWEEVPETDEEWTPQRGRHVHQLPPAYFDPEKGSVLNPTRKVWRRPGYLGHYRAEHAHRIEIDPATPRPWSLVFVAPKRREWGFWTFAGWRPWRRGEPNPICEDR